MDRQGGFFKRLKLCLSGLSGSSRLLWPSCLCLTLCLWGAGEVNAEKVALVIGNQAYHELRPLNNPENDARAVAEQLGILGFRVIGLTADQDGQAALNLKRRDFLRLLNRFRKESKAAEMALIYYAGHGAMVSGDSILLPVDVSKPESTEQIPLLAADSISLQDALNQMSEVNGPKLAIFDACREILDSGTRSIIGDTENLLVRGGLKVPNSLLQGNIIAFAGASGQLVIDGNGAHSPYTTVLLEELKKGKGRDVTEFLETVGAIFGERNREQLNNQQPEYRSSGVRPNTFFLSGKGGPTCVTNADSEDC